MFATPSERAGCFTKGDEEVAPFIGIHNAWDSVIWIAVKVPEETASKEK